jgi:hypothetical protein
MLQMSGAIDEEGSKIRAHSTIVMPEQIELQAIGKRYLPPLDVCLREPLAAKLVNTARTVSAARPWRSRNVMNGSHSFTASAAPVVFS